ncbi:hypothetical protein MGN70_013452 [Eutypa lata]|nr:hypothetical protein MGN70_013452 [Eutypa lata]
MKYVHYQKRAYSQSGHSSLRNRVILGQAPPSTSILIWNGSRFTGNNYTVQPTLGKAQMAEESKNMQSFEMTGWIELPDLKRRATVSWTFLSALEGGWR